MPYKEVKVEKMFYSIGEVADIFGVNTSLIRFWANTFPDIIKPQKNKKGNRLFMPVDVDNIKLIYHLVKEKGMTLEGARMRIKGNKDGEDKSYEVINSLKSVRELLLEIKEML